MEGCMVCLKTVATPHTYVQYAVSGIISSSNRRILNRLVFLLPSRFELMLKVIMTERIYNPITAMGFSAMFTFQLDNTKR